MSTKYCLVRNSDEYILYSYRWSCGKEDPYLFDSVDAADRIRREYYANDGFARVEKFPKAVCLTLRKLNGKPHGGFHTDGRLYR